jgi:hypothetical protein
MVAPGHCSPSRKVVSKMMTRSFSDLLAVVIAKIPYSVMRRLIGGAEGFCRLTQPLSAQAQTPSRPSGADKKQQPEKPGGQGRSGHRAGGFCPDPNSRHIAANQHAKPLRSAEILGQNG